MPPLNALLAARYNKGARSLLGLEEQEGITTVTPELGVVVVLEGPQIEYAFLRNEILHALAVESPAVAAVAQRIRIRNPADSGALCIIDTLDCLAGAVSGDMWLVAGRTNADLATVVTGLTSRDTRNIVTGPTSVFSFDNTVSVNKHFTRNFPAGATVTFDNRQFVLTPGSVLDVSANAINSRLSVSFGFRERGIRPSELVA